MKSIIIQIGKTTIIIKNNIPKGLDSKASINCPFRTNITDLVVPQDGQGKPIIFLNKQA